MGLDLFDKLSDACEAVRKILEKERDALHSQPQPYLPVAAGTKVHVLVANLTSLTNPAAIRQLADLTESDKEHRDQLRARIRDLKSQNPTKIARHIDLRITRLATFTDRIEAVTNILSDATIDELFLAQIQHAELRNRVDQLRRTSFQEQPLAGTGSEAWRALWNAAAQYSTTDAYPERPFPYTRNESHCVLCQEPLTDDGATRLRHFAVFLESVVQNELDAAERTYRQRRTDIDGLTLMDDAMTQSLDELQVENTVLATGIRTALEQADLRRTMVKEALDRAVPRPQDLPSPTFHAEGLSRYLHSLRDRARELREPRHGQMMVEHREELNELDARQILAENVDDVLEHIERKKRIAAYQLCIDETRTNAITRKSTDVTKRVVTEKLAASFAKELEALKFRHVEVQMVDSGGSRGALYHKLQLRRAPGVDVSRVASEGEARCLSIASFFAELSTASERSAILFDDPVSSLDHDWRENVATRLVAEAKCRQVIVFTHDIVFLLALSRKAEASGVYPERRYLRRDHSGAGLSSSRLPWPAMKVKDRVGYLKDLWQAAEKTLRVSSREKYEMEAQYIYGLLREAWERALEEVLLAGTVERYRRDVQTQHVSQLADISADDCKMLGAAMTKCSTWLPGHDQAPAENAPIPEPAELLDDIKSLEGWIREIRRRRD